MRFFSSGKWRSSMRYRRSLLRLSGLLLVLQFAAAPSFVSASLIHSGRRTATDWSVAMVESTMKRFPTAQDLGSWGYAKSLYLYGQYLVWRRTGDPRYLQYIKDWIDSHVDNEGNVFNTDKDGKRTNISFTNLDSMLPGNLLLLLHKETKDPKYKVAAEKIRKKFDTYKRTSDG